MTADELFELVALQRQHARHGFGGLPPANLTVLRAQFARLGYTRDSKAGETKTFLVKEAIVRYHAIVASYGNDPAGRKLMREAGVHNVHKLLAALQKCTVAELSALNST